MHNFNILLSNNNKINKNTNSKKIGNFICPSIFKKDNILNALIYKTLNISEILSTKNMTQSMKKYKKEIKFEEKMKSYGKYYSTEKITDILENSCHNRKKNNVDKVRILKKKLVILN